MTRPAKGKKSIAWDRDPEILDRLAKVESLHLEGLSGRQIADRLGISEPTVRRDLDRVAILMHSRVTSDVQLLRERSLSMCRKVQLEAWESWHSMKEAAQAAGEQSDQVKKELFKGRQLSIILEAERMVIDLQGTKTPVEQTINFRDGERPPVEQMSSADLFKRADALRELAGKLLEETKEDNAEEEE